MLEMRHHRPDRLHVKLSTRLSTASTLPSERVINQLYTYPQKSSHQQPEVDGRASATRPSTSSGDPLPRRFHSSPTVSLDHSDPDRKGAPGSPARDACQTHERRPVSIRKKRTQEPTPTPTPPGRRSFNLGPPGDSPLDTACHKATILPCAALRTGRPSSTHSKVYTPKPWAHRTTATPRGG
jgi:hypothetical protein